MIREWRLFLVALQFLTRFPTPSLPGLPDDWLVRSAKYFPLVGALVGGVSALVFLGAHALWPAGPLPALLALAAGILMTGALHEDGLADTADALGGHSPEQRRAIMKDPRLGTYGALALGLVLAAKAGALTVLAVRFAAWGLVGAHVGGRAAAAWAMSLLPYAAEPATSRLNAPRRTLRSWELALTLALALAPCLIAMGPAGLACAGGAALAASLLAWISAKRIGGHTGDVLGAVEQAYEVAFLLILSALGAAGRLA